MTERLKVLFVIGGESLESSSSLDSATHVMSVLSPGWCDGFLVLLKAGQWSLVTGANMSLDEVASARFDDSNLILQTQQGPVKFDVVFIAIHGEPAETGHLQAYLEWIGMPYVGSGVLTSALSMDKTICKLVVGTVTGVKVPTTMPLQTIRAYRENKEGVLASIVDGPGFPCIVKPNAYGSGFGVNLVQDPSELLWALEQVAALDQPAVVEAYIAGRELTVGAVLIENEIHLLPVIEVFRPNTSSELAAFGRAGFTDRKSAHLQINPPLKQQELDVLNKVTRTIGQILKCRDFYRVDYILSDQGELYFLEVNTIPGMGKRSVFTQQIQSSEIVEGEFYANIIERAWRYKIN